MNEWEKQYEREYRRIQQAIRRQEKLGYFVPDEVRPAKRSNVKTITQQHVQSLTELTPKMIRKSSVYLDQETGEAFPGLDVVNSHHKARPSTAKIGELKTRKPRVPRPSKLSKGKRTRNKTTKQSKETPATPYPPKEINLNAQIIDTINNMLAEWQPAPYWHASFLERKKQTYHKIYALWKETLLTEGEYEVAHRLESNATEIIRLLERLLYSSDSVVEDDFNLSRFIELLIGRALTAFESDSYNEIAREAALDSLRGENSLG